MARALLADRAPTIAQRLRRAPLGVRLAVLSAALAGGVIGGTFFALSIQTRATTRRLFAEELSRSQRTLIALQRENRRRLVLSAALLAESPTLRSAIATYRVEERRGAVRPDLTNTVRRELERLGRDLDAGALLATDERGRVFAGYVRRGAAMSGGTDLSTLDAVHNALDPSIVSTSGEPYLSALGVADDFYAVGVAPVIVDGYTIGALVFGERVDSALVGTLRGAFDGEVVASAGPHLIAATMPASAVDAAVADSVATGRSVTLGHEEYLAAVIPMGKTQQGTELRVTLLRPLSPMVHALTAALRRDFLLYGVLTVLLAGLGAALLARSVLEPLWRFIGTMRAGAVTEHTELRFDADDTSLEIRTLNESFTQLMIALGRERGALERRGAELAAANAVLTDEIAQRERVTRALRESEAQLRQSQKLEAIGTLAGGIAHDFNNLLTIISGFTQLAQSQLGKDHLVADDLRQVMDAARSAAALTHQLLAFSRKQVLQPRVLDLDGTVAGVESMLRRLLGARVELAVGHEGPPARVKADPSQLEQVLLNLAVNARDAMPEGGRLTIATGIASDASGAARVALRVTDTGTGMPPEVRERIFEPFYTTKESGKGTGLGLSMVYGVVAQSGGTIDVVSAPGRGTTFTLLFPPASEPSAAENAAADDGLPPRGTETVLLVEDDGAIRALAEQVLASCGYTVVTACSGVEALTAARTMRRLDVLLTDVVMPQLSGPQLVERILEKHPAPCVVYMTGWVDDSVTQLELDGAVTLLRKPFTPLELARTVRAVLDGHASAMPMPLGGT